MITCRPDWVSELSSEELHELSLKTVAEMQAKGELDQAVKQAMEYLEKLKCDRRVTSAMWNTPFI